jgi:predicted Zn-dependent peptidase
MRDREVTSVAVWIKAGGRYEKPSSAGISHFLEHLVFRGTKKRTAEAIKQAIEGIGGSINAFTSKEYTCYYAKVPKKHLPIAIEVLSDIVQNPLMSRINIRKEKKIITEEIKMYKDIPSYHVDDLLNETMWKGHPLGRPLAGTYKSVRAINKEKLKRYKKKFYHSANMVVTAGGNLEIKRTKEIIKDRFSGLKPEGETNSLKFTPSPHRPVIKSLDKDTQQTHLSIGFHTTSRTHPNRYPLVLLSVILGGNMSSRLFQKIREEEAMAYQISASLDKYMDNGAFIISAGIKNNKADKALALILEELKKIKKEGVGREELHKAKEFVSGQTLINMENSSNCVLWIGTKIITGDPVLNIEEAISRIRQVSPDDIARVADLFLRNNNISVALIGPLKKTIKNIRKITADFN